MMDEGATGVVGSVTTVGVTLTVVTVVVMGGDVPADVAAARAA